MAVAPLFVADMATLQAALRLTGLVAGSDGAALLDQAVLQARLEFNRRLGTARVAVLVAINYAEDPDTSDELLRALANQTEVKLVRHALAQTMPMLFMDASADLQEVWNTEGAFRQGQPGVKALQALKNEITKAMDILAGKVAFGDETQFRATTIDPTCRPPKPGDTLFKGF